MMKTNLIILIVLMFISGPVLAFDAGVYYIYDSMSEDNFNYTFGLMDLARSGCTHIIVSGNTMYANSFWATARNWDIKGITAYNILNGVGEDPIIDEQQLTQQITADRDWANNLTYMGNPIGDVIIGKMIQDEVECAGLTIGQQDYLSTYCNIFAQVDPNRKTYINHCDTPWYDLNEGMPTCSTGPAIEYNYTRITTKITEAQRLGYNNFYAVAQTARIAGWMDNDCPNIEYYGFGPCTTEQKNWLASRTAYEDVFDMVFTPYSHGAAGVMTYLYNGYNTSLNRYYTLVDPNGNDSDYKRQGYSDAVHYIRQQQQGWPEITLLRKKTVREKVPLHDRTKYPAGQMTISALFTSGSAPVSKVVFGISTTGGATWATVEDISSPYENTFTLIAGTTAIIRAQAVATDGKKSIWSAYMFYIVNSSEIGCGDYESGLILGDINVDCIVDLGDISVLSSQWLDCDDPQQTQCGTWNIMRQFDCGQTGSGFPSLKSDISGDCKIDLADFVLFAGNWLICDNPAGCP